MKSYVLLLVPSHPGDNASTVKIPSNVLWSYMTIEDDANMEGLLDCLTQGAKDMIERIQKEGITNLEELNRKMEEKE